MEELLPSSSTASKLGRWQECTEVLQRFVLNSMQWSDNKLQMAVHNACVYWFPWLPRVYLLRAHHNETNRTYLPFEITSITFFEDIFFNLDTCSYVSIKKLNSHLARETILDRRSCSSAHPEQMVTRSFTEFYGVQRNKEPQRTKRELKRHADQRRVGKVMSLTRIASSVISGVRHRVWQVRVGPARRWKASTAAAENLEGPEPPNGFLFNEKVPKEIIRVASSFITYEGPWNLRKGVQF